MPEEKLNMTQRELIIRIDERVKSMDDRLRSVEKSLIPPSEHIALVKQGTDHEDRLSNLEKWQSRVIGYGAAAGAVAGIILNFLQEWFFQKGS